MENGYEYPDYNQDGEGNNMDDPNRIHAFANQHAHMSQPYADHHGASYGHEAHQLASVVAGQNLAHIQVLFDEAGNISSIPNLAAYISFQSNPAIFLQHPHLKKIVLLATEQAIREILMPVMDRSISIAGVATREIILKDFSSEMHEERMRRAAGAMGSYLAGSLASVTSREPFRISMTTHLRTLFAQQGIHEVKFSLIS